jgi:hypothetical protein
VERAPLSRTVSCNIYDLSDPVQPTDIPPGARIIYPPRDIAVLKRTSTDDQGSEVTEKLVAPGRFPPHLLAAPRRDRLLQRADQLALEPVHLQRRRRRNPRWVGAVTLTQNILDGYPIRAIAMDGSSVFVATARKGIQIVSLARP